MALTFHPNKGQILMCDFTGFQEPEMVKRRPVLVIAPTVAGRTGLVTIAAISTVKPDPVRDYHMLMPARCMPKGPYFQGKQSWLKGDMVYTVSFGRLDLIPQPKLKGNNKRQYFKQALDLKTIRAATACVLHGIGQGRLVKHL